jgi:hypothetical protein
MALKEDFYSAAARWLNTEVEGDVAGVTDWDEHTEAGVYGCETCAYDQAVVDITYYLTGEHTLRLYVYEGTFSALLDFILEA